MNKEERINEEKARLFELFKGLDENKLQTAQGLINSAAFMAVSLADLEEIINSAGYFDEYQNGENQHGTKISAAVQAYNSMAGRYTTIVDKLLRIVPLEKRSTEQATAKDRIEELTQKQSREKALRMDIEKRRGDAFIDAVAKGEVQQSDYKEFCEKWDDEHPQGV